MLALFSPLILQDPHAIMKILTESGHTALMYYILQQIQQFQLRREDFVMQHTAVEYMDQVSEELKASVIAAIPAEDRLRGLSVKERLQGLPTEEFLRGLTPEELLQGLPPEEILKHLTSEGRLEQLGKEQLARLRKMLERDESD